MYQAVLCFIMLLCLHESTMVEALPTAFCDGFTVNEGKDR